MGTVQYMMRWLDNHPDVVKWNSEEVVIPYFCNADGKKRRYFMDFWARFKDGQEFLFEVKPAKETKPPVRP
ncbi:TnsA endonuclease N-terminal domain-containing protein, partial [Klebsiella pneumoniae]|uniref:TnsA endonuclease N-terminal domain-containing protein n=1 Tax=Klebsiella pneumoniae TaxID=573 RepID=UPI00351CBF08